ncbi:MAG TPA: alpha/beta hydrolase [Stellaceae bacterium]
MLILVIAMGGNLVAVAMARSTPPTAERVAYGQAPSQFGELWLPAGGGPAPVAVLVHGGCWQSAYGLDLMDPMAADLHGQGIGVWNIEYRRLGEASGGYPGTFLDVGQATDALRGMPQRQRLDLRRIVAIGHSAGGHLALWAAARPRLPRDSALATVEPQRIAAVVTLAGIDDLAAYRANGPACGGAATIDALTGAGSRPPGAALSDTSPPALLPIGVRQVVASGSTDGIVPARFGHDYAALARRAGDPVEVLDLPGDHFALIDPGSSAWTPLRTKILELLR